MQASLESKAPTIDELYALSEGLHGHLCPGVILGTRMAVVGVRALGLKPGIAERGLTVFVETARCATDAIQATTRATLGQHTLRVFDYGKMAATFAVNGRAVRVVALESSRAAADRLHPEIEGTRGRQLVGYREMPDEALFALATVQLLDPPADPHKQPRPKAVCGDCGETFEERKGIRAEGKVRCAPCAREPYWQPAAP